MTEPTSPVRVAVVQFDPQVGIEKCAGNLRRSLELALEAVNGGANLIVLPELSNTGYFFSNRQDAFAHAEAVPDGPSVQRWIDFAREHNVYLVAGLAERDGMRLFNTGVLVGPDGFIGKYRKAHLWNLEKLWFTPGDLGFPVFDTPIGRIGLLICWDIWFPEQGDPLPLRLKIVQKSRRGEPAVDLTFTSWDLAAKVTDATFVPKVPADYEGIAIIQRAAAVKAAAAAPAADPTAPAKK